MVTATHKAIKQVQVIARYELNQHPGIIVYKVRSSDGKSEYQTTIYHGKASSCTCPATKPCYHMTQLEAREQDRKHQEEAEKRAAYVSQFDPCGLGW